MGTNIYVRPTPTDDAELHQSLNALTGSASNLRDSVELGADRATLLDLLKQIHERSGEILTQAQPTQVHLGKFSIGWPFAFRAPEMPDGTYGRYDEWLSLAKSGQIVDEYGDRISLDQLLERIAVRHGRGPAGQYRTDVFRDRDGREWREHEFF